MKHEIGKGPRLFYEDRTEEIKMESVPLGTGMVKRYSYKPTDYDDSETFWTRQTWRTYKEAKANAEEDLDCEQFVVFDVDAECGHPESFLQPGESEE